jgi:hypothetical protein
MSDSTPDIVIRIPHDVANARLGKTRLITILKQMGAEVVEKTSQKNEIHVAEDIAEVFDYHQSVLGKHFPIGLKLNDWRRKTIRARRNRFSVDDLKKCIDYVASSPFHLGQNDSGKKYLDFDHIMSSDKKVERKLAAYQDPSVNSQSEDQLRLTIKEIGGRIRSGEASIDDRNRFVELNNDLSRFGVRYNWRTDIFE